MSEANNLVEKAIELLRERARTVTYKQIAAEIDVPHDWLKSFAIRGSLDASSTRVQKLYEYLTGSKLKI